MFISGFIFRAIIRTSNVATSSLKSLPQGKVMFSRASVCSPSGLPLKGAASKGVLPAGGVCPTTAAVGTHPTGMHSCSIIFST